MKPIYRYSWKGSAWVCTNPEVRISYLLEYFYRTGKRLPWLDFIYLVKPIQWRSL